MGQEFFQPGFSLLIYVIIYLLLPCGLQRSRVRLAWRGAAWRDYAYVSRCTYLDSLQTDSLLPSQVYHMSFQQQRIGVVSIFITTCN